MTDTLIIVLRTFIGYLILIVLMKFMGKREIGQLSLFDLLILLTIVDIMVVGIENYETNYLYSVVPMVFMAIIQKIVALISLKKVKFRELMDGKVSIIIENGKINIKEMKKNGYNMDDLYCQLRGKDVVSPSEVSYGILETNGKLSVFLKKDYPDMVLPLIVSGTPQEDVIKKCNLNLDMITGIVKANGYKDVKEVYGLNIINGKFVFVSANPTKKK
ncbi:MAG: DUF421 domain-containing protein [Bacilli bacterium]|nr:DUF421 domain-containing protein [Bacilli bacterium]MDD7314495.1 DUF421 domain-containing protein [Bacilli bacterium]MDY4053086.1 DUF421 domain-containing protein [Bacilli bacterium]